jgi:hypothetical protein
MFQLATCQQLIELRERYPQYVFPEEHSWGLKEMGTLFCADKVHALRPQRILEVGVGSSTFFDEHFGTQLDYWGGR